MIDRAEILARNPLVEFLERRGIVLRNGLTNRCAQTEHKPKHLCVSVDAAKQAWYCHDCEKGGSVIDWVMIAEGVTAKEAMERLGGDTATEQPKRAPEPSARQSDGKGKVVKTYDYRDETGTLLFQVARFEPKDFRQRAPDGKGSWIYKLDLVRRVPYNLAKVIAADTVFICEGEKDADSLIALGLAATTNCGGSKKWEPTYTPFFRGKDLVLLPDNDKAGHEHRDLLKAELGKVAKSIRIVEMPEGVKDVSDFLATYPTDKDGARELIEMAERAEVLYRGQLVPVQTMSELEEEYRIHVKRASTHQLQIGNWLPALRSAVRPAVPGELVTILAGTGCGKTMFLQNLAMNTMLETLFFETELPGTLSFERFAAMSTKSSGRGIESLYTMDGTAQWRAAGRLDHISMCHKSRVSTEDIGRIIENAALKTCRRPVLVLVDYIQLVQGTGESRYERTSGVAEQLKVVAKETGTIIVMASQIGRAPSANGKKAASETREVSLTDGKDSGSIENSSGLVLGGWRDADDKDRLWLKILKNTKGKSGLTFACRINESLLIHQEETQEPTPSKPREDPHAKKRHDD